MKPKITFLLLILLSFVPKVFATDYYTASASATLAGNTGAVNTNWTTNPDGLTGLTTVTIAATDNLIIFNGGTATITASMTIGALTISQGGTIVHNNNTTGTSFNINGLLTWNGNIKTLQAVSGSNFFNANSDIVGSTALLDTNSNRGIFLTGTAGKTINLIMVAPASPFVYGQFNGLQIAKDRVLAGNCKLYCPINYNQNCILDLANYSLQVPSIQGGVATTRVIKGSASAKLTLSGAGNSVIFLDPTTTALNALTIEDSFNPGTTSTIAINGDLAVNTLKFGTPTSTNTRSAQLNGNFALANNGTMQVQTKGTTASTQYSQLKATGNIAIASSATLQVNFINSYNPLVGTQFDFAQSTGGGTITGSFGTIQTPNGYTAAVSFPTGKVQYQILTVPPPAPACSYSPTPDLPLLPSNVTIEAEINTVVQRFSDSYLGTSEPTATELNAAIASYNALGITVNGYNITAAVSITSYDQATFLKTFAQYLKFHPEDTNNIYTKALNTVWLISDLVCKGTLIPDLNQYSYKNFGAPAILIPRIKDNSYVKSLFENLLDKQNEFRYFWEPTYSGGINIDHVGNSGVVTMSYVKWIDNADERYRYFTAFKRFIERYCSYSKGADEGIKPDGSGFHHEIGYPSYMCYSINAPMNILYYLRQTSFQVSSGSYLLLRDAAMAQIMFGNDKTVRSIALGGRKPQEYTSVVMSSRSFLNMALAGGSILNTGSSDPVAATLYNRMWGNDPALNNSTAAPFNEGYFQFNHSMAGIYRKDGWVATCRGANNVMFGAEIFGSNNGISNRFGRYQSYGTVDIIYAGDNPTDNGYDETTRDWNFVPGTTVIRLPWDKLEAEEDMQEEYQQKSFVGSLSFTNKKSDYLKTIQGTYGMFAMDFQEKTDNGWGGRYRPESHNPTFVFKKSVFAFDNMLICLGSNIGNNDATNTTLTTLYQRKAITGKEVVNVDNTPLPVSDYSNTYANTNNHWVVDNFSTGFYVFSGSGIIKLTKANQQTPQHNLFLNQQTVTNNPIGNYAIGYLDHGTAPSNKGYEYICIPKATSATMVSLDSQITNNNKPYTVHRKDNIAHILEYKPTATANSIFGYAFFSALSGINNTGQLTSADFPCLVMAQYDSAQKNLKIAVNNPDLGFSSLDKTVPSVENQINITIKGTNWSFSKPNSRASITGTANGETTIQFKVIDGLPVEILLVRDLSLKTLAPVADSYVRSIGYADQNFGTDPALVVKKDGTSDRNREIYLKFDLNSINSFDNATLRLNLASAGVNVVGTTWEVYHVPTDSWSETGITWNNKPASSTLLGTANGQSSGWVEWNITSQAQTEFSGDKTVSLRLVSTFSDFNGDATFRSKEDTDTTLRPQLLLTQNNPSPVVEITSPDNNVTFTVPTSVTIDADASDRNNTVTKVEFYQGTTKLGEDLTAPYSFTWDNVTKGNYSITAKATDNIGNTTTSAAVAVTVNRGITSWTTSRTDATISGTTATNWDDGTGNVASFTINSADSFTVLNGGIANINTTTTIGGTLTVTGTLNVYAATIVNGTTIINPTGVINQLATTGNHSFSANGDTTWNGTVKVMKPATGSNYFSFNGNLTGTTGYIDTASNAGIYLSGTAGKTINLTMAAPASPFNYGQYVGLQIAKDRVLSGNCKIYCPINYNQNCTLDLATYSIQVQSIQGGSSARLLKSNGGSLTISGGNNNAIFLDPAASTFNALNIDDVFYPNTTASTTITGDLTVSTLNFGNSTSTNTRSLIVNGNFTLANNGTIHVQTKGTTAGTEYNQLKVQSGAALTPPTGPGNFSLGTNTTLQIDAINSYIPVTGDAYNLVPYAGTFGTNNFATTTNPSGYNGSVTSYANPVTYTIANNVPPTVSITSPVNNTTFTTPATITIVANATDTDGTISKVEFFQGSTKLGEDLTAPYSFSWANAPAGKYSITAVATDNVGAVTTSGIVTVLVNTAIGPLADTYVRDGSYATTNYGTANTFYIKKDGPGFNRQIYLKFDLNGVNNFDQVILQLNIATANTNPEGTNWQIYYVPTDSWTETGINWNNKPAYNTTLLATIPGRKTGLAEWNISSQALAELAGDKILSIVIVSPTDNSYSDVSFYSKEATDVTLRPKLILTTSSQTGRMNNEVISKSIIEPETQNSTVQIYPNPVKDILHIDLGGHKGDTEGYFYDLQGRMVLNQKLSENDTAIDVSKLSAGIYVVKIYADSEMIVVKKIVKM